MKSVPTRRKWGKYYFVLFAWCFLHWSYLINLYPEGSWMPFVFIPFYALGSLLAAGILTGIVRRMPNAEAPPAKVFHSTFITCNDAR